MMQSTRSRSFALLATTGRKLLQDAFVIFLVVTLQANLGLAQEVARATPDQTKPGSTNSQQTQAGPQSSPQQANPSIPQTSSSLVLPAGTKLPLGLVRPISVTKSKPGDSVYLQVTFPITAGHQMLVPPGTYVQGIIGKIIKRDRTRALLSFSMRSANMIFSTGYTVSFAGTLDTLPTIAGLQPPAIGGVQAAAPVAMAAAGSAAPPPLPPLPKPSLGNGPRNTMIALVAVGVVGTALALVFAHHQNVEMDAGTPLEIVLPAPLQLDPARVAEAVQQYSAQAANTPPPIIQPPKKPKVCYDPGTPGTPDTVIPGTPGTPPTVIPGMNGAPPTVIPGTPATPDTVIPGTPGTPGREYPCK
jgi:hypothetical protein